MVPKLYMAETSPAVRAVLLTAEALGITLEHVPVDIAKQEHLTPEFLQLNPQHTVPTLVDDGEALWDSHAIITYLTEKYGKDDSLYPKDPYKRAIINQRLHFDSSVLFSVASQAIKPIFREGATTIPPEQVASIMEAYEFLEQFLEGHLWIAGDDLSLADFSLIPTVTTTAIAVPLDEDKFPNTTAWIQRAQDLPYYYDVNHNAHEKLKELILSKLNS